MPRLTTRDYKRPSRSSSAARLKEFGLGVLVGAVLASAAFLIVGAHGRHRSATATHARAGSQTSAPHAPATDATSSDGSDRSDGDAGSGSGSPPPSQAGAQPPQYDFYRMLPRFKVPVPDDDNRPSHAPPPQASPPARAAGSGPSYVLQVGSYRSTAEADQVRARLARAGISAQVQRIVAGSRAWNRVRIGPLTDTELAKVRDQLQAANMHALVIREDR
jgi:cell division septation protein DedD